jgi:hypothetical protein
LFINPTVSTPPALAQAAKQSGGSVLHALDAAKPITDQIEAAHKVVDELIARHGPLHAAAVASRPQTK